MIWKMKQCHESIIVVLLVDYHTTLLCLLLCRISVRVLRLPSPQISAHVFQCQFGFPTKFLFGQGSVGITDGDIARSAVSKLVWELTTTGFTHSFQHIHDGVAITGTQIENTVFWVSLSIRDGVQMALRQVHDVNVISDARAETNNKIWIYWDNIVHKRTKVWIKTWLTRRV